MPSLIPDYEYDIFISYRQKDNLPLSVQGRQNAEGWVTEFVAHLKRELEVTFKEEVSVYIDENTYDGIREVHEVNESLASKLKCVIFIPIISQTYCDPKSYAWNNEFLIFKQLAMTDRFGLKVKLRNGNVASRIIPIRIHELDVQDGLLLMKELGGPLRSIDFIFRTPGVNRPLRAHEDHPNDNRNKTYYRDQINKVANSIKEIMVALQSPPNEIAHGRPRFLEPIRNTPARKWLISAFVLVATVLLSYFLWQHNFELLSGTGSNRATIAVIPFKAIGDEEESKNFAEGVTDVIISNLIMFPELKVKSRMSVEKYKTQPKTVSEIAADLGVIYILEGSAQKFGDKIRIIVRLVDARADENVWSEQFDKRFENIFEIQNQISVSIARSLKAKLTPAIAEKIKRTPTSSFEAYDLFLRAKQWFNRYAVSLDSNDLAQAISTLRQSLKKDSQFAMGNAWLAGLQMVKEVKNLSDKQVKDSIVFLAEKALELDSTAVESYIVLSELYFNENDDVNALRQTYKALEHIDRLRLLTDPGSSDSVMISRLVDRIAAVYARVGDTERALTIYDQMLRIDSGNLELLHQKFYPLAANRQVDQLMELLAKIKELDEKDPVGDMLLTHALLEQRDYSGLETLYYKNENVLSMQMNLIDQYVLVYAAALRKNGKEKEAIRVATKFQNDLVTSSPYLQAQFLLFVGHEEEALQLLESVDIGWYNLNLCLINPVFEPVKSEVRFKKFVERNSDRIRDKSDRIYQLEKEGYLPRPEEFIQKILSRRKSGFSNFETDDVSPTAGQPNKQG